jgi:hypothetical protein
MKEFDYKKEIEEKIKKEYSILSSSQIEKIIEEAERKVENEDRADNQD